MRRQALRRTEFVDWVLGKDTEDAYLSIFREPQKTS